jgi:hypothetical protein
MVENRVCKGERTFARICEKAPYLVVLSVAYGGEKRTFAASKTANSLTWFIRQAASTLIRQSPESPIGNGGTDGLASDRSSDAGSSYTSTRGNAGSRNIGNPGDNRAWRLAARTGRRQREADIRTTSGDRRTVGRWKRAGFGKRSAHPWRSKLARSTRPPDRVCRFRIR